MIPLFDQNPARSEPVVTRVLIYLNVFVFLLQWWLEAQGVTWVTAGYGMVPARLTADPTGEAWKILSSMFLHGGLAHLGWNMLFLYIFGDNVEDRLGKQRYISFYLLSGVAAGAAQYFVNPASSVPMVGASGAIAGVLGGYLVLYPRAPVAVLNPIPLLWLFMGPFFALPAWFVVGEWFVGNLFGGLSSLGLEEGGGVAFFAHLGGFVMGLVLVRPLTRGRPATVREPWRTFRTSSRAPRQRGVFWKDDGKPFWK